MDCRAVRFSDALKQFAQKKKAIGKFLSPFLFSSGLVYHMYGLTRQKAAYVIRGYFQQAAACL